MAFLALIIALANNIAIQDGEPAITVPTLPRVAIGMLALKKGLPEREVEYVLGLKNCILGTAGGTLRSLSVTYPVEPGFYLFLEYQTDQETNQPLLEQCDLRLRTARR
jgi:hypothetical protein